MTEAATCRVYSPRRGHRGHVRLWLYLWEGRWHPMWLCELHEGDIGDQDRWQAVGPSAPGDADSPPAPSRRAPPAPRGRSEAPRSASERTDPVKGTRPVGWVVGGRGGG